MLKKQKLFSNQYHKIEESNYFLQEQMNIAKIACLLIIVTVSQRGNDNLIINGNFTEPYFGGMYTLINFNIKGWSCSQLCELDNCKKLISYLVDLHITPPDCHGNVIDLNSQSNNQIVSQQIQMKAGAYQLNFNYYYPPSAAKKKQLQTSFNNNSILYVHPQIDADASTKYFNGLVEGKEGMNVLAFQNAGQNDGTGFKINNVSLIRVVDTQFEDTVVNFFSLDFFQKTMAFPGGRVILGSALSFFINLDRYQFYSYHQRLYSYNAEILLVNINILQSFKGNLVSYGLADLFPVYFARVQAFLDSLNYKDKYITYASFEEDVKNANFCIYIKNAVMYSLPIAILLFLILHVAFRIMFQIKFSKFIRQFEFYGILLPLLLEGNIEELVFYCFAQFKSFFTFTFKHKCFNIVILVLFFIVVLACFGLFLFFKYHYGKKANILIDTKKSDLISLSNQNFDKGVIIFCYGAAHQLMLSSPESQIGVLGVLELLMIIKKLRMRSYYEKKSLFAISLLNGFLRFYFQITTYLYSILESQRNVLNQIYQKYFIYLMIGVIILEIVVICWVIATRVKIIWRKYGQISKIMPMGQQIIVSIIERKEKQKFKQKSKQCTRIKREKKTKFPFY